MKILFVSHTAAIGGAEHTLLDLLDSLTTGHECAVVVPPGALARELRARQVSVIPGVEPAASFRSGARIALTGVAGLTRAALAVRSAIREFQPEVVHANSVRSGLIVSLLRRDDTWRQVIHVHDVLPEGRVPAMVRSLLRRRSDGLLFISEYVATAFGRPSHGGHASVVFNPVNLKRFASGVSRADGQERLGLGSPFPLLVMVAQITPWKGQDHAIRVLNDVRRALPKAELIIAGDVQFADPSTRFNNHSYRDSLVELARQLGVEDRVRFIGHSDLVPEVLAAADIVLMPSWQEPFGRIALEGMAAARVVLSTNVGGPPEFIDHGRTGFLLDPMASDPWVECIVELATDPSQVEQIERAAREAARPFAQDAYTARVLDAYATVTA